MPTIAETQEEIVQEFSMLESWEDRYTHLIEMGREIPKLPEAVKTDDRLVKGCQSRVWLLARQEDGKMIYEAESDALIVEGLIALLLRVYSHRTPREVLAADTAFLDRVGLSRHLSPSRTNGLHSMIRHIRRHAELASGA
ncbi:MAG: SufE family protein [Kiritimatiellia bacterium]